MGNSVNALFSYRDGGVPEWEWLTPILVVAAIGLVITTGSIVFKAGRWVEGLKKDRNDFADGIQKNQKSIADIAKEIRADIKKIFHRLPPPDVIKRDSPSSLTEYGQRVATAMGASEWAENEAPRLAEHLVEEPEFIVEEKCRVHVQKHRASSHMVLQAMYEHGITRDQALSVLRIVLRDTVLELRSLSKEA